MAILNLVDNISNSIDKKKPCAAVFIDLSKAFDTIDHTILLKKLHRYGFRGTTLQLLKSYLSNRSQCVFYQNTFSSSKGICCGVPQGSILGPVLFLIYINDIYRCSTLLNFILFADDTTLFYSAHSWTELSNALNEALISLCNWFKCNKLSLNVSKTNFIAFHSSRSSTINLNIMIDNEQISQVLYTKFLGVEIDYCLSWKYQIKKVENKISSIIGVISRIRFKIDLKTSLMLYNSLVLPYLDYCNILWASNYKTELLKLYVLQKRAIRICTKSPRLTNSESLFKQFNILSVFKLNSLQIEKFMFLYSVYKCNA